jgi:hypothetical protein
VVSCASRITKRLRDGEGSEYLAEPSRSLALRQPKPASAALTLVFLTGCVGAARFCPPKRNHVHHSGLTIRTTLGAFLKAVRCRSSIEMRLSTRGRGLSGCSPPRPPSALGLQPAQGAPRSSGTLPKHARTRVPLIVPEAVSTVRASAAAPALRVARCSA